MDTALPQKFSFILDRNLAKANCTGNRVCTSCDIVVLGLVKFLSVSCILELLIQAILPDIILCYEYSVVSLNVSILKQF